MSTERANSLMAALSPKTWPDSPATVSATLARMPDVVGTSHLVSRKRTEANYGRVGEPKATLTIAPLKEAAGPSMSMPTFFESFAESGQFTITSRQPTHSKALYFVGVTNESPQLQVAAWARRDGQYLFGAEAAGSDLLGQLVRAFQTAAVQ